MEEGRVGIALAIKRAGEGSQCMGVKKLRDERDQVPHTHIWSEWTLDSSSTAANRCLISGVTAMECIPVDTVTPRKTLQVSGRNSIFTCSHLRTAISLWWGPHPAPHGCNQPYANFQKGHFIKSKRTTWPAEMLWHHNGWISLITSDIWGALHLENHQTSLEEAEHPDFSVPCSLESLPTQQTAFLIPTQENGIHPNSLFSPKPSWKSS